MNKADLEEMKEDRLANAAIVAFLGSLLMGQAWGMWEGSQRTSKLLVFTVPDYSGLVIFTLMAGLFTLSLFLATASVARPFQRWGLVATKWVAPVMLPILLASFILSWLSSTLELPHDQWWAPILIIGGFAMFIFIGTRSMLTSLSRFVLQSVRRTTRAKPVDDTEANGPRADATGRPTERKPLLERMRNLRGYFRLPQSGEFWIILSVAVIAVEVVLVVVLWDWLTGDESGSATIRNIGLVIAGSLAIPLAIWRAIVADRQASSAQHQTVIAQQSLLNERYQKAAEMLGNALLSVRLGGIYALQALIEEHAEQYYVRCMRLLCAFVRNPPVDERLTPRSDKEMTRWGGGIRLRADVQAVMDMMRSRDDRLMALEGRAQFEVDFRGSDLRGSNLRQVNFTGVDLRDADLSGAYAVGANMSRVGLSGARLYKTMLAAADLSGTYFSGADISRTWFCGKSSVHGRRFDSPAIGIELHRFYRARARKGNPPILGGVVLEAKSQEPLVWEPSKGVGIEYVTR